MKRFGCAGVPAHAAAPALSLADHGLEDGADPEVLPRPDAREPGKLTIESGPRKAHLTASPDLLYSHILSYHW